MGRLRTALTAGFLAVVSTTAQAGILSWTDSAAELVDNNLATPSVRSKTFGTGGSIVGITAVLDFMKCGDLTLSPGVAVPTACPSNSGPAYAREIFFRLISPANTVIDLIAIDAYYGPGSSDPDPGFAIKVTLQDSAPATAVVGNSGYQDETAFPSDLLGVFNGTDAAGTWTLEFGDDGPGSPLLFLGFNLTINTRDGTPAPLPGTLALLGVGLVGLGALRRRR